MRCGLFCQYFSYKHPRSQRASFLGGPANSSASNAPARSFGCYLRLIHIKAKAKRSFPSFDQLDTSCRSVGRPVTKLRFRDNFCLQEFTKSIQTWVSFQELPVTIQILYHRCWIYRPTTDSKNLELLGSRCPFFPNVLHSVLSSCYLRVRPSVNNFSD